MIDSEATLSELRAVSLECRHLHIATHGVFRTDNPLFSYLQFADGPLRVLDVYSLKLDAELVTLSACESGLNDAKGSDLIGLGRSFFYAGAANLVVSLWPVDDKATTEFMREFYQRLGSDRSIARALQDAQIALRESYPHPFHWAPFIVMASEGWPRSSRMS